MANSQTPAFSHQVSAQAKRLIVKYTPIDNSTIADKIRINRPEIAKEGRQLSVCCRKLEGEKTE